jgi:hypothetical protein
MVKVSATPMQPERHKAGTSEAVPHGAICPPDMDLLLSATVSGQSTGLRDRRRALGNTGSSSDRHSQKLSVVPQ